MSNTKKTKPAKTLDEKLASVKRIEDRMVIHFPGPLRAEWTRIKDEFDQLKARKTATEMLNPDPEERKLAAALADLEEQMREDSVEVTLRALRRQRTPATPKDEATWLEIVAAHPPRKGADGKPEPRDAASGFNWLTFPEALIRASVVDPVMTPEQWDMLLYEVITDRQFDALYDKAFRLNRSDVDIPFSHVASKTLKSGTPSRRRNGSGSPQSDSAAGSPSR